MENQPSNEKTTRGPAKRRPGNEDPSAATGPQTPGKTGVSAEPRSALPQRPHAAKSPAAANPPATPAPPETNPTSNINKPQTANNRNKNRSSVREKRGGALLKSAREKQKTSHEASKHSNVTGTGTSTLNSLSCVPTKPTVTLSTPSTHTSTHTTLTTTSTLTTPTTSAKPKQTSSELSKTVKKEDKKDNKPKNRDEAQRRFVKELATFQDVRLEYAQKVGMNLKVPDEACQVFKQNLGLGRYKDVVCIDNMRVVLTDSGPDTNGDFIHANYVSTERLRLILTQGPTPATVNDLWRLVWQERVPLIVMLCEIMELGKVKCAEYWPRVVGDCLQQAHVTVVCAGLQEVRPVPNELIRVTKLRLTRDDLPEEPTRFCTHVQWANWPDKSVPNSSAAPLYLCHLMSQLSGRNVVIHCSAGIGRTGTLACLQMGIEWLDVANALNVRKLVLRLRKNRAHAVQTELQYLFIIKSLIEHIRVVNPKGYLTAAAPLNKWIAAYLDLRDRAGAEPPKTSAKPPGVSPTTGPVPVASTPVSAAPVQAAPIVPVLMPAPAPVFSQPAQTPTTLPAAPLIPAKTSAGGGGQN